NFVVVWDTDRPDGFQDVFARMFDSAGSPVGNEFRVNTSTVDAQSLPSISPLGGGGFIVAWQSNLQDTSGIGIYAQQFDGSGHRVGTEFQVNTTTSGDQIVPNVSGLSGGDYVVTWSSSDHIFAQRFAAGASGFHINVSYAESVTSQSPEFQSAFKGA